MILLILLSGVVFGMSAYFGIGTEYLSKKLTSMPQDEFEMHKAFFIIGQSLLGLFYGSSILFIPALFFWSFTDVELDKLIVIQFLVLVILLIEKIVLIPFTLFLGLTANSSPFSFGVIIQYFSNNDFIVYFLASITLFTLWALFIEFKYLRVLTEKGIKTVLAMVIGFNVAMWFLSSLISIIEFEKLI